MDVAILFFEFQGLLAAFFLAFLLRQVANVGDNHRPRFGGNRRQRQLDWELRAVAAHGGQLEAVADPPVSFSPAKQRPKSFDDV